VSKISSLHRIIRDMYEIIKKIKVVSIDDL